jgi:hypothetical protein
MGAGTDEEAKGAAKEEREAVPPSSGDPAGERSYEDGWYRSLAAWGRVGARADDPRGVSEDADRMSRDGDPTARDSGATDTETDEEIAST